MKTATASKNSSGSKAIAKEDPSETTNVSKPSPPAVIRVDTKKTTGSNLDEESGKDIAAEEKSFRQDRTPKHANKTMAARDAAEAQREAAEGRTHYPTQEKNKGAPDAQMNHPGRGYYHHGSSQYSNIMPYDSSNRRAPPTVGGTNGAFSPPSQYKDRPPSHPGYYNGGGPPPTVSPGGNGTGGGYSYYNREGQEYRSGSGGAGYAPPHPYDARGPPPQHQGYRDHQRGGAHYSDGPYPQQNYAGPSPPGGQYTSHHYPQSQGPGPQSYNRGPPPPGYQDQRHAYGVHPPPFQGHQHPYGGHHPSTQEMNESRYHAPTHNTAGGFTRAVSSSFDRSLTKSRSMSGEGDQGVPRQAERLRGPSDYGYGHNGHDENGSIAPSDDSSWRQLNQVASIDDEAIRERLQQKKSSSPEDSPPQEAASTSSSLTNSPVEHHNNQEDANNNESKKKPPLPTPSKLGPLDSLSSVASAQEPMETQGSKDGKARANPPSPEESSTASLDLMKCHSGSSGLLHSSWAEHHQEGSVESLNLEYRIDSKRSQEQRGDVDHKATDREEIRKAPPGEDQRSGQGPPKRHRPDEKANNGDTKKKKGKKSSPMSIQCSPPASPKDDKQGDKVSKASFARHASPGPQNSAYFDQPPAYTYSLDSAPSFEKNFRKSGYPPLPPRPGSASSSTITPMVTANNEGRDGVGPSLPSWDLQNQDSFGGSTGNGLMSSFSFSQDYPSLSQSNSFNGPTDTSSQQQVLPPPPPGHGYSASSGQGRQTLPPPPNVAESRNQSFEGGHYHGSFSRSTDSQDMHYSAHGQGRQGAPPAYNENFKSSQYNGPYPPQSSSWGTSGSAGSNTPSSQFRVPPPPPTNESSSQYNQQQQQRTGPPPGPNSPRAHHPRNRYQNGSVIRNYSEDSNMRVSPPMMPHMMHSGPPNSRGNNMSSQQSAFQPPPEFSAPQNTALSRRPPPQVYIMSSPPGGQSGTSQDPNSGSKPNGPAGGVYSWTKEDDVRLTEVMKKYKNPRDWEPIATEHARGKTAKECHERWIRYLKPGVRKGQWQDHEDAIVVEAVTTSTEQPFTRWSDLAQRLPGRVGKQIRDRWVNHLNPNINHLPFSREDDLLLWNGHIKLGKRWVEISTKFFNSSRSENHIKNRWYSASFKKFISNEFGPDAYSGGKSSKASKGKKDDKPKLKKIKEDEEAEISTDL